MTPNGMRILDSWGFNSDKARAVYAEQIRMVDAKTLEPLMVDSFTDCEKEFGHKMKFFHRADLHSVLRSMAEAPHSEQPGEPVSLSLGRTVVDVDCETGTILLDTGSIRKDLVVLADGIRVMAQLLCSSPSWIMIVVS